MDKFQRHTGVSSLTASGSGRTEAVVCFQPRPSNTSSQSSKPADMKDQLGGQSTKGSGQLSADQTKAIRPTSLTTLAQKAMSIVKADHSAQGKTTEGESCVKVAQRAPTLPYSTAPGLPAPVAPMSKVNDQGQAPQAEPSTKLVDPASLPPTSAQPHTTPVINNPSFKVESPASATDPGFTFRFRLWLTCDWTRGPQNVVYLDDSMDAQTVFERIQRKLSHRKLEGKDIAGLSVVLPERTPFDMEIDDAGAWETLLAFVKEDKLTEVQLKVSRRE